jgi:hypothetical protein
LRYKVNPAKPKSTTIAIVNGTLRNSNFERTAAPLTVAIVVLFGFAGITLYRKRKVCEPGSICADPKKYKRMVFAYRIGLIIALLGLGSPYLVAWLF